MQSARKNPSISLRCFIALSLFISPGFYASFTTEANAQEYDLPVHHFGETKREARRAAYKAAKMHCEAFSLDGDKVENEDYFYDEHYRSGWYAGIEFDCE